MSVRHLIFLVCLLVLTRSQCSAYCSTCASNSNSTCATCPSNFIEEDPPGSGICVADSNIYPMYLDYANGDLTVSSTDTCGTTQWAGVPGIFASQGSQEVYFNAAMPPHYQVRVRISALFIDYWNNGDTMFVKVDGTTKSSKRYDKFFKFSGSNSCFDNGRTERYSTLDTGDFTHNATTLNVTISVDRCDCSSGNSNCKPCGWMLPEIMIMVKQCHDYCLVCYGVENTQCRSCTNSTTGQEYLLTVNTCDVTCGLAYYQSGPNVCSKCATNCTVCTGTSVNCSECAVGYVYWPVQFLCPRTCPDGYYFDNTTNQCEACDLSCLICTGAPSPCSYCNVSYFLLGTECIQPCPSPLYQNVVNRTCQDCNVYCIYCTISFYIPRGSSGISALYVDLNFTEPITFADFPMDTFQTVTFANTSYDISMFNVTYIPIGTKCYRISLEPIGFAFLVNQTVTATIMSLPATVHNGSDGRPFRESAYGQSISMIWSYIKPPNMTQLQTDIVQGFSSVSTEINSFTTKPGIQEVKKFGFLLLALNSLQITSCLVLLNMVLPQNLYEGIRFFASFIFFDVPPWEQESVAGKRVVVPPVDSLGARRRLSTTLQEYRFRRTGFTNVFLFDCYNQIIAIGVVYVLLLGIICLSRRSKRFKTFRPFLQSMLFYFHEIALMYFTLTILFQFTYFDPSSAIRIVSLIVCIAIAIYYLLYHVYRYYDMMQFSYVELDSPQYIELVTKYGSILKNIRFEEYKFDYGCSSACRNWLKPYNYHTMSYVKKLLMMLTFPIFYYSGQAQIICLVILQVGEVVRFCLTWPFSKKWRNIYRLLLEIVLLLIFCIVFAISEIADLIYGNTPTDQQITLYFNVGWIGFGLIMTFNFGFLILTFIDMAIGCKYSNKELIDQNRRMYYFQKLNTHEQGQEVDVGLVGHYVKRGNLNNRQMKKLPNSNLRIQNYQISKLPHNTYRLDINNVLSARINSDFTYKEMSNNAEPTEFLKCDKKVTKKDNIVYDIVEGVFETHARKGVSTITIKTFAKVEQKKYKPNELIDFTRCEMSQELILEYEDDREPHTIQLDKLMPGFPIPEELLKVIT